MGGVELCLPCHGRSCLRRASILTPEESFREQYVSRIELRIELQIEQTPHDFSLIAGEQSHDDPVFRKTHLGTTLEAPWNFQVSAQVVDKLVELVKSVGASEAPKLRRWRFGWMP